MTHSLESKKAEWNREFDRLETQYRSVGKPEEEIQEERRIYLERRFSEYKAYQKSLDDRGNAKVDFDPRYGVDGRI